MKGTVEIKGAVGAAIHADSGSVINIHLAENKLDPQIKRAVHHLLKTCEATGSKPIVEKISQGLFGSAIFKALTLEQLAQLQVIADEISAAQQSKANKEEPHTAFVREIYEYEDFYRRIGIRASKVERAALTEFMVTAPINPKQIKLAWTKSVLIYENNQLKINLPVIEPLLGSALALMCSVALLLIFVQIILVKPSIYQLAQQAPLLLTLIFALLITASYMIAPAYIGKRIKAVLEPS